MKDKESAIEAMNTMFYYAMNFPFSEVSYETLWEGTKKEWLPKFIGDIDWGCNLEHIVNKWKKCEEQGGYYGKVYAFYAELDDKNRKRFLGYILDNYHC